MENLILQLYPSYISKVWRIDLVNKPLKIPRKGLRIPVTRIINKVITPVLSSDIEDIERVYSQKIAPFRESWIELIQSTQSGNSKGKLNLNLPFYGRTITMINNNPIFAKDKAPIIDTIEILKDYEMIIHSIIIKREKLLESALNEIDVNDLLFSLYGSYLALIFFWLIARNEGSGRKIIPAVARISHNLAINLASYGDTLDIMTNPEEMDMMKRAEQWEKHKLQNRAQ